MTDPQETPQPADPAGWHNPGPSLQPVRPAPPEAIYEPYPGDLTPHPPQPSRYYAVQPSTNGLAIASFILSLVQLFIFPAGVLAIIFGHIAMAQIKRTRQNGQGLALTGLILGYVGVALAAIVVLVYISTLAGMNGSDYNSDSLNT